ncbi:MAG TPA: hypothetical protein PK280_04600 [Planctomycetota bacterium]|nr:hypothetical protein [Planctomycetota bacterium]
MPQTEEKKTPRPEPRAWCFTARLADGASVAGILALALAFYADVGALIAGAIAVLVGAMALINIKGLKAPPASDIPDDDPVGRYAARRIYGARRKAWMAICLGLVGAGLAYALHHLLHKH